MLCASCVRVQDPPTVDVAVVVAPVNSEQQPFASPTRADSFTYFQPGQKVGLYMVNYVGATAGVLLSTGNHADNQEFVAGADNVLRKVPPIFYPKPDVATKVDIYAYSPFKAEMSTNIAACPFEVAVDQRGDTSVLLAQDLVWAKNLRASESVGIVPSAQPVPMEFVHKFSKVRVTLNIATLSPSGKRVSDIANVSFNGVFRATTFNLATGVVTLKNGDADLRSVITPREVRRGAPGAGSYIYDAIIPAQTFIVGYNFVTFDLIYDDNTRTTLSYKVDNSSFGGGVPSTKQGKIHKINLTLSGAWEVTLTGSTIIDWATGVTENGTVDNQVTTSFKATISNAGVTAIDRVVMTTDFEGSFDIKSGVTFDPVTKVCTFKFEKGKGPRDYGFRIQSLQFFSGDAQVTGVITKTSARVYTPGLMDIGTWGD